MKLTRQIASEYIKNEEGHILAWITYDDQTIDISENLSFEDFLQLSELLIQIIQERQHAVQIHEVGTV